MNANVKCSQNIRPEIKSRLTNVASIMSSYK
jgi:hypothetical protein